MRVRVALPAGGVHEVELRADAAVSELVARVAELEAVDLSTHRVRLVAAGKLLADGGARVAALVAEGGFVHCAVSEKKPERAVARRRRRRGVLRMGTDASGDVVFFFGEAEAAGAGEGGDGRDGEGEWDEEDAEEGEGVGVEGGQVLRTTIGEDGEVRIVLPNLTARGFDRLGLPPAEVAALRRQFRETRGRGLDDEEVDTVDEEEAWLSSAIEEDGGDGVEEENEEEGGESGRDTETGGGRRRLRRRRRGDGRVVVATGIEGTNTDFLFGCVCGYLLGVLTMALLLDKNISRRWRVGIIAGVATNAAFGVLRNSLYFQSGTSFPGR